MTLNLIKALKTIVYNANTPKTPEYIQKSNFFNNQYLQELDIHSNQCFPLICMFRLEIIL